MIEKLMMLKILMRFANGQSSCTAALEYLLLENVSFLIYGKSKSPNT